MYSSLGRKARYVLYGSRRASRIEGGHNHRRPLKKWPLRSNGESFRGGRSSTVRLLHPRLHSSCERPAERGESPNARNDSDGALRKHMPLRWLLENCRCRPQSQQPPQSSWRPLTFSSHTLRSTPLTRSMRRCKFSTNTENKFLSSPDQPMFP